MNIFLAWTNRKIINYIKYANPDEILEGGKKNLIPVFKRVAKNVPLYKEFLEKKGIDLTKIKDTESFKNLVPVIDKKIFNTDDIAKLCLGGSLKTLKSIMLSSGYSGVSYSFGLNQQKKLKELSYITDFFLDLYFNINHKKTLFINCLGMGTKVYTNLPSAETSVRADTVIELVKKFSSCFEQIIIISNPYFVKKIIEDGAEQGIDWKSILVNLIIGEDWFPEGFRGYLAQFLGIDFNQPEKGLIASTMGICELGFNLFFESKDTIRIRRLACEDQRLREALFGEKVSICPILFHYHPCEIFLEEWNGELIFTTLNRKALMPLIRYNSKDRGKIHSYNDVREVLTRFNYQDYIPEFKLPLVSVMGRSGKVIEFNNVAVTPEQIKTGIYSDFEIAGATTGYFRMTKQDTHLHIEVQLKEGRQSTDELKKKFCDAIAKYVKADFELLLYSYKDFPYGIGLIYENKFKYI